MSLGYNPSTLKQIIKQTQRIVLKDNSSLIDFSGCKDIQIEASLTTCFILKKMLAEDSNALGSVRALSMANLVYERVEDSLAGLSDFKGLVMLNLRGLC